MKKIFLLPILLVSSLSLWAHALYIDTKPVAQKGKPHEVKVYYGEYADGKPEELSHWYSDVKQFTLWLLTPDGKKVQLKTDSATDYFIASFTPEQEGAYQLVISHSAKDLGKTTMYQWNTHAIVTVGKTGALQPGNALAFTLENDGSSKSVKVTPTFNGQSCDKCEITIISPTGWTKELSLSGGSASFKPESKGKYLVEVTRMDKETGEHHGKTYDGIWRCATMLIDIR